MSSSTRTRPGRIPLNTLASAFGLAGVASTWSAASAVAPVPDSVAAVFWSLTALTTIGLLVAHTARGALSGTPLRVQLRDPVQAPLAVILPLVGMLIGIRMLSWLPAAGSTIVIASMIATAGYAGWLVSTWMTGRIELGAIHGGYILPPVAGGFITATAAEALGLRALGWAAFGVGCFFWVVMTSLVLVRLVAGPPLPDGLTPTLTVLMAPPAVGGIALFALTDGIASPLSFAFAASRRSSPPHRSPPSRATAVSPSLSAFGRSRSPSRPSPPTRSPGWTSPRSRPRAPWPSRSRSRSLCSSPRSGSDLCGIGPPGASGRSGNMHAHASVGSRVPGRRSPIHSFRKALL